MKTLAIVLALLSFSASASGFPIASSHIADCEDRWFFLHSDDPDSRVLGFAYVDPTMGVTMEHRGELALGKTGNVVRKANPLQNVRVIVRVTSNFSVACLAPDEVRALSLPSVSEFLRYYEDKRPPGPHDLAWASHYNEIGASERALSFVAAAKAVGYDSPELVFEEAYAYNATRRFSEAVAAVLPAIQKYQANASLRAELAFSYVAQGAFPQAIALYKVLLSENSTPGGAVRIEYATNLAAAYRAVGDQKSADEWQQKTTEWKKQDGP